MGLFDRFRRKPAETEPAAGEQRSVEGRAELSEPPPRFSWHHFIEPRVAVLKPDTWHAHEKSADGSFTGCVSKENVKQHGSFQTGLTVQHICRVLGRLGLLPSVFAVGLYQQTANDVSNTILNAEQGAQQHGVATFVFRYRNAPAIAEPIIVHQFLIAHDLADQLYIFTFESPEQSWQASWAIGGRILKELVLDIVMPSISGTSARQFAPRPRLPGRAGEKRCFPHRY